MASLKKRDGTKKPWQVRYRDHTGRDRSEQFSTKADATTRLREVQTAEETGRIDVLDAGTATLSEVGVQFFQLHKGEWKANTAKGHAYVWNVLVEGEGEYPRAALADMAVRNIRKSHVLAWRNDAIDAGAPASSVKRTLSLITRTLDHAADEDMIAANPASRVEPPKASAPPKASIITPEQVEQIRAQMDDRDAAFVSILAYLGLRPHEARALKAAQLKGDELHLEQACAEDGSLQPLKGGHELRDVPICQAVKDDLQAVKWSRGFMFPNVHGEARTKEDYANWRNRRFKKAVKAANAKIVEDAKKAEEDDPVLIPADLNPYDLRHSIASLWYRQGIDKATIAAWLGHSIPVLESVYTSHFRTLKPDDKRTVDQMIAEARK